MVFLLMEKLLSTELVNFKNLVCDNIFFVPFINKLLKRFS